MADDKTWEPFTVSLELGGWRQKDGTLSPEHDKTVKLEDWPKEIKVRKYTYTLESVDVGTIEEGRTWESAVYV